MLALTILNLLLVDGRFFLKESTEKLIFCKECFFGDGETGSMLMAKDVGCLLLVEAQKTFKRHFSPQENPLT